MHRLLPLLVCWIGWVSPATVSAQDPTSVQWLAGLARVDVTPREPVRMAGYGSRDHASEGIDTQLFARCLALKSNSGDQPSLLISVDTIGLPGAMTRSIAAEIETQHGISRDRMVFCSTHTHAGPDLVSELSNIFAVELSGEEREAGKRYRQQLHEGIVAAARDALNDLAPAELSYAVGEASFAANRRVLTNGRWSGFGVQPDGPVDHAVPVLRVRGPQGKIRGVVFNYACHCTTLGGDHYRINGDWAGYAAANLESKYADAIAVCTIGCGADANPEPRGSLDATKIHGRTLAAEVAHVIEGEMKAIDAPLTPRFDYAALSFDLPTAEELQQRAKDTRPQTQRHAEQLLQVLKEHGRLPATYPVPIQSWQFGDQLTMIFLGGEVVVDYALRLKDSLKDPDLWVTAYANDVLGYIVSERMRLEGGYEYDRSGIYYGLPGPWATGSEDLLIARIETMLRSRGRSKPVDAGEALNTIRVSDGFEAELVAAEPLVRDPVNVAFDIRGRLWVVEMGDYPEDENGGRIKTLIDNDGDGVYDKSIEFLSGLSYPTGVFPWRDGVLVSAAPDILFARDTDQDGKADDVQTLYTGFRLANPQHRINGFTYGLDHSLHLASGDNLSKITSTKTGETVDASGHDVQIWPDSGRLAATSGRTQFVRSRNDWGEWFGNDNSRPMYHFPIDDRYLQRNPAVRYTGGTQQLFDPPVAPPVFPLTASTERFNDLFAAGRFTSACSAIVAREPRFDVPEVDGDAAFICEPVHNLVHRAVLEPSDGTYHAVRGSQETESEFMASSDPWFRPVRVAVGPDAMLYVVDMYRETIEHPEWIPEAWQAQLDLRAGSDRGRIYRIRPSQSRAGQAQTKPQSQTKPMRRFDQLPLPYLVQQLKSENGALRDLAQQWIIERDDDSATPLLVKLASDASDPKARVHALSILDVQRKLDTDLLSKALQDSHPGVLMVAIQLAESRLESDPELLEHLANTAGHEDRRVVLRTALALGQTQAPEAGTLLSAIAARDLGPWVARAVVSSARPHADTILDRLLKDPGSDRAKFPTRLLTDLLRTSHAGGTPIASRYRDALSDADADFLSRLKLATSFVAALGTGKSDENAKLFEPLYARAIDLVTDGNQPEGQRCEALQLVGIGIGGAKDEQRLLLDLLDPVTPLRVQQEAVDRLAAMPESEVARAIFGRWPSMSKTIRDHCVVRMLERRRWTEKLLDAIESGDVSPRDLTPAARQQLTHTGTRSMRVRATRLTRMGQSPAKRTLIQSYLADISGHGDRARGAALFKQHCAVCHVAADGSQPVGASLDNLTDRSEAALLTAILDPNRAVDPKFQSYVILTDEDRVLVGAIESEAGQSVTIAHADGKRTTVGRKQIAQMKNSGVSLMPEGLEAVLPPPAMRNLIEYLQRSR